MSLFFIAYKNKKHKNNVLFRNAAFYLEKTFDFGYNKNIKQRKESIDMSVLKVNKSNFDQVKSSEKKVLLDFYADWCGPCRMVSPLVDQIAEENPQYLVCKINVDDDPELAQEFGVASIPTLVVMQDGRIVEQSSGARPKSSILSMLED